MLPFEIARFTKRVFLRQSWKNAKLEETIRNIRNINLNDNICA